MENKMFCNQCQETFHNQGCIINGVCGKSSAVSNLMDELIEKLKILVQDDSVNRQKGFFIAQSLFMTITNTNFDMERIKNQIDKANKLIEKNHSSVMPKNSEENDLNLRSIKDLLLYTIKGIAAYTYHASILGYEDDDIYEFFYTALRSITQKKSPDKLISLVMEAGNYAVKAMELLDEANCATYGNPQITTVRTDVNSRPGILVSGHDLRDLEELLEQTLYSGIDIYTHGEMLAAHYYPELKKYSHLYGNYGNSWYLQYKEFALFNGPILITSNCITPIQPSYEDRIFTTSVAGYEGIKHIPDRTEGKAKDFSEIIKLAKKSRPPVKLEDGKIIGGFAHNQLFNLSDKIISAIKAKKIKHFIVMAGCDGRAKSREYYTKVAQNLPDGTVILTAGCAKYRYNKLKLTPIDDIPRVIDAGQCNDSFSLALFALKLKEDLSLKDVNELPISFDIAWYEQKAVAILVALLSLGFKNIKIGPTFPAFLSPDILQFLNKTFGLTK